MLSRFRSWLRGLPSVVTLWSAIFTIGFCGVYILVNLGIISPGKSQPPDCVLGADLVTHGQQITCTGKDLDLVAEFRLVRGNDSYQVPFTFHNESRTVLIVTSVTPPGEYRLEITPRAGDPITQSETIKVVSQLTSPPAPSSPALQDPRALLTAPRHRQGPIIMFSNPNWNTARLQTAIARFIVEHGYGYRTETIPPGNTGGNAWDLWRGLIGGTIDVIMETWLPNLQPEWDEAIAEALVVPLGKSMEDVWQSAFVVPTYVIKGDPSRGIPPRAPDLETVGDLKRYAEVFATPSSGKKAVLVNCPAIWTCRKITEEQVKAYGLDDVIEVQTTPSGPALFSSLMDAYKKGAPWLGYVFGPGSKAASELDLTILKEPVYSSRCIKNETVCGYSTSQVMLAVHPRLPIVAPDVYEFLRDWYFTAEHMIVAKQYLAQEKSDVDRAAVVYLKNQQAVWTQWVPTEVVVKVKKALRDS